ncbi:hypothetical protein [Nocardioides marmotae]|uniref:hypothetical protein n=1 Tax=Nocardioides marmotae TaxID=2663857 RepID=UPI0012B671E2|nr:hypothetical protein [Nocardioides marmotae]MBC9733834.1 hypothetical protein [Nocardioides marmotae]MTB84936.1 hypothetical protein [Nocardioides marmotae]
MIVCRGVGVFDNGVQQRVRVELHEVEGRDEEYMRVEPDGRPVPTDPDGNGLA